MIVVTLGRDGIFDNRYFYETQDAKPEFRFFKDRYKSRFDTARL